jgi:hypothetical protein
LTTTWVPLAFLQKVSKLFVVLDFVKDSVLIIKVDAIMSVEFEVLGLERERERERDRD